MGVGHLHAQQPRVIGLKSDDLGELFAECFGNP
jgi:hypothetical protein